MGPPSPYFARCEANQRRYDDGMKSVAWFGALAFAIAASPADAQRDPTVALDGAQTQFASFRYHDAAASYEAIARDASYASNVRKDAATNAAKLRVASDERDGARAMVNVASQLQPTPDERVALDYLIPQIDYARWRRSDDAAARAVALSSLGGFFGAHRLVDDDVTRTFPQPWRSCRFLTHAEDANRSTRSIKSWSASRRRIANLMNGARSRRLGAARSTTRYGAAFIGAGVEVSCPGGRTTRCFNRRTLNTRRRQCSAFCSPRRQLLRAPLRPRSPRRDRPISKHAKSVMIGSIAQRAR